MVLVFLPLRGGNGRDRRRIHLGPPLQQLRPIIGDLPTDGGFIIFEVGSCIIAILAPTSRRRPCEGRILISAGKFRIAVYLCPHEQTSIMREESCDLGRVVSGSVWTEGLFVSMIIPD